MESDQNQPPIACASASWNLLKSIVATAAGVVFFGVEAAA